MMDGIIDSMSRLAAACLFVTSMVAVASAQGPRILPAPDNAGDPTHAVTPHLELSTSSKAAGTRVRLFVDIAPRAAFHIYAPGVKDYKPATLTVLPATGVTTGKPVFPKAELRFFEEANDKVPVYAAPFRVEEDVTLDPARAADLKAGRAVTISGTFAYQACDDRVCYKPTTIPVEWKLGE